MKASKRTRSTSTPARRALSASPPVASRRRPKRVCAQQDCASDGEADQHQAGDRNARASCRWRARQFGRRAADAAVGVREDHALQDAQHAEGEDQRLDAQPVDQPAVRATPTAAPIATMASATGSSSSEPAVGERAGQHDDQPEQLADRQIDQPAGDDEGLADRDQAERRRLGDDVGEVVGGGEARNEERARATMRERRQPVDAAVRQRLRAADGAATAISRSGASPRRCLRPSRTCWRSSSASPRAGRARTKTPRR